MYKVVYRLPENSLRTLVMSANEFRAWAKHRFLRSRLVYWERVNLN